MIKIQLGELKEMLQALDELAVAKLPVKTAYWVQKFGKKLVKEYSSFEEQRKKIIDEHGKRDEKGNLIIENGQYVMDDAEAFAKEYNELASITIELDFNPITIEQLGNTVVTPSALARLEKYIISDDDKEAPHDE